MSDKRAVGEPISRLDGHAKVTGQARYAAEAPIQNCLHATILSSTIAKGKITRIDAAEALRQPGVVAVITPESMPKIVQGKGMVSEARTPLADMAVHYAGQHIAVVVADTPERSQHAASLVKVTYDSEPVVIDPDDPRATEEKPKQGMGDQLQLTKGDIEAALRQPELKIVHATYRTPVETHNPMEMGATTATWESSDRLTAWNSTQGVSNNQAWLATTFGLDKENVRVLSPFTGGGFGCKGGQWPHIALAAAVAKAVGRPVRQMLSRQQMFTSCGHRPSTEQTMTLAAGKDGKLDALRHDTVMHGSHLSDFVEPCALGTSLILYPSPNYFHSHVVHKVDVAPPTFTRAPGESSGTFAIESAMDELANELGIDPVEFRLINHADVNPHTGQPWSSKHLKECYQIGRQRFGWERISRAPGSMKTPDGRQIGWGMATATYPARKSPGSARIRLYSDGTRVRAVGAAASQDIGTGTWTIGAQMTATLTGLPVDRAKFEIGDSSLPTSGGSGGSTTAASIGKALSDAAHALVEELLALAQAEATSPLAGLDASKVTLQGDRLVETASPHRSVDLAKLISSSGKPYVEGVAQPPKPAQAGTPAAPQAYAFNSFGAHFVEVVIDAPCPRVIVKRVVSVIDVGTVLNPKTAQSQIYGGVVMGIGMALMEETLYDPRTGRPMTTNLADYHVPVNADIGEIDVHFVEYPDTNLTPFGNRGVGEIGITGVAAAVANAVYHATGKRVRDLPITPDKLL